MCLPKRNKWNVLCKYARSANNRHLVLKKTRYVRLSEAVSLLVDEARVHTCKVALNAVE